MAEKPLALVFTSLLLALKSSAILAESWFQWRNIPVKTSKVVLQILAALMGCFALVLGSVAVSLNPNIPPDSNNPCTRADADIVGDGVRTATWVQVGM
jgi:hypothetical protein